MDLAKVKEVFLHKGYSERSATSFASWMKQLNKHYSKKELKDISFQEIKKYVEILEKRRNLGPSSRIQAKKAFEFWYNTILDKDYPFDEIVVRRKYNRLVPEYFSEDEILELIASSNSLKARMIISIAYGCGLDVSELCEIKKSDVDFKNGTIKVYNKKARKMRYAKLPETVVEDIQLYLKEYSPKKWLFEGKKLKGKLPMRGAHWAFNKALENSPIQRDLHFRALKYSYIKHLESNNVNLLSILSELNLNSSGTYYALSIAGVEQYPVTISPLDYIHIPKAKEDFETYQLKRQIETLENDDEKEFLLEAIKCLDAGAYRAGIIFTWNFAVRSIHHRLLKQPLNSLNTAIQRHFRDARTIKTEDDFAYIKESTVLKASMDLGEFDKNQKKVLEDCLDIRNSCSHPGKYSPNSLKTKAFIEDILNVVFIK